MPSKAIGKPTDVAKMQTSISLKLIVFLIKIIGLVA